ncbi:hypothetical protein M422DRAFT_30322 [Sphaerobolus stellatus SS14]|uniref:F-box domain-containing protein n=1 Tax=Sphaerobolus stellatus (strain SS14) TaxID=990650 RepID=A0A0C9UNW8_SPHS4|nr:hypothetical protein M422DRAFT_30322 [Sphaerobolus stellatus SS14]
MEPQVSLSSLPFDILDGIAFAIEDRRDLLDLALTSHQFHDLIFPKHIHYRILSCNPLDNKIWRILRDNPGIASRFSHLALGFDYDLKDRSSRTSCLRNAYHFKKTWFRPRHVRSTALSQAVSQICNIVQFTWHYTHDHEIEIEHLSKCKRLEMMDFTMRGRVKVPERDLDTLLSCIVMPARSYRRLRKLRLELMEAYSRTTFIHAFFFKILQSRCPALMDLRLTISRNALLFLLHKITLPSLNRLSLTQLPHKPPEESTMPWIQFFQRHTRLECLLIDTIDAVPIEALTAQSLPNLRRLSFPDGSCSGYLPPFSQDLIHNLTCIDNFVAPSVFPHYGYLPKLKIFRGIITGGTMLLLMLQYAPNLERLEGGEDPCWYHPYEDAICVLTQFQHLTHIGLGLFFNVRTELLHTVTNDFRNMKGLKYLRLPGNPDTDSLFLWMRLLREENGNRVIGTELLKGKDLLGVNPNYWGNFFRDIDS